MGVSLSVGTLLGRYRVLEFAGAGGMGAVYRARDERLDRDVALKVLPDGPLADAATRDRFRTEALALSRLNHPNIATIHDFDSHAGVDFLVMEWVPGEPMADLAGRGALGEPAVVRLGRQLAEGLASAHAAGVIHRDLKPGNLRLTRDGRLKVLDFGLARLLQPVPDLATTQAAEGIGGTLPYMAPEQVRGSEGDARSDIYAAGAVLFELATGERVFGATTGIPLMEAILHREVASIRTLNPHVSPALEHVILTALDKDPGRRYQSAREMAIALDTVSSARDAVPATVKRPRMRMRSLGAAIALAAAAVAVWVGFGRIGSRPSSPSPVARVPSIAVLPLDNLSGDPAEESFADGMTEALITDLAKIRALRVISRTSVMRFKGVRPPMREIVKALQVDAVVEGSVLRVGDRVRITAQLIDADTDEHLWAETYDRELRDVLSLQAEVARAIASQINVTITPDEQRRLASASPINPAAHRAYLEGRYFWNKRSPDAVTQAVGFFERAISLDAGYAAPYAGLADSYVVMPGLGLLPPRDAMARARAAASRAIALDPGNVDAYISLGYVETTVWNWAAAEAAFRRARELNPERHTFWRGSYLSALGRHDEAIAEAERGQTADPLSPIASAGVAWMYHLAHRPDRALEHGRRTLELDPVFEIGHFRVGWAHALSGRYDEAVAAFEKAPSGYPPNSQAAIVWTLARAGRTRDAEAALARLQISRAGRPGFTYDLAVAYAGLGDRDRTLEWLQKAVDEGAWGVQHLGVEPIFDRERTDPRFTALVRRMGLTP